MGDSGHFPVPGVSCLFSGEVSYLLNECLGKGKIGIKPIATVEFTTFSDKC